MTQNRLIKNRQLDGKQIRRKEKNKYDLNESKLEGVHFASHLAGIVLLNCNLIQNPQKRSKLKKFAFMTRLNGLAEQTKKIVV